ncbi:MAG: bifunctional DNA-formamidopyrimidine glycosylase/DNA-(apurinic or apyrimidinic site) lyase [Bryobacteraceae bacterium]
MPELPEVETVVRSLARHLPGRKILAAEFHSKHVTPGDRKALAAHMAGRTIEGIRRRGKYIYITLDQGAFSAHLGMTGKLLLDAPIGKHAYGIFSLDDGVLVYDDPRQFGSIEWDPALEEKLGPEPLEISAEEFIARLIKRTTKMKALLLDQSFIAGVGNIYADEILYAAGVHPLAIAAKVSKQKAALVHQAMREILALAIEHRGSSISDYVDAEGNRGGFQLLHNAYGREGEPCMRCFGKIRKILVAQRGTHYCPKCQKR